ncbi:hypothetical protein CCR87_09350 [Rhodobaculum claviforme]|uniref:Uncharacterized protein n=1 Tax=Rhodobaculum claviforme TaxID=1549854 RepID=A0A934TM31_9RHOB|nr:hypothetical protein [Rhodobaculum claviforme]
MGAGDVLDGRMHAAHACTMGAGELRGLLESRERVEGDTGAGSLALCVQPHRIGRGVLKATRGWSLCAQG